MKTFTFTWTLLCLFFLFVSTVVVGDSTTYPLIYTTSSGASLTRLNMELARSGLQNVQLVVSGVNKDETLPKDELVRVSIGNTNIFTTAVNLTKCEKFLIDVNKVTLEPIHIEQVNCKLLGPNSLQLAGATTGGARAIPRSSPSSSTGGATKAKQSNQNSIVYLRSSLREASSYLVKSGRVSFEGVATPKNEKETEENNQSFFRKYWYFIVPAVLMLVISSIGGDDQGGAQ